MYSSRVSCVQGVQQQQVACVKTETGQHIEAGKLGYFPYTIHEVPVLPIRSPASRS